MNGAPDRDKQTMAGGDLANSVLNAIQNVYLSKEVTVA